MGGLYSFEWVDAVASVFQLISLVGKLSGVLMRYVIRVGPDVFISMGAEAGWWGVFTVQSGACFSGCSFSFVIVSFCHDTAAVLP